MISNLTPSLKPRVPSDWLKKFGTGTPISDFSHGGSGLQSFKLLSSRFKESNCDRTFITICLAGGGWVGGRFQANLSHDLKRTMQIKMIRPLISTHVRHIRSMFNLILGWGLHCLRNAVYCKKMHIHISTCILIGFYAFFSPYSDTYPRGSRSRRNVMQALPNALKGSRIFISNIACIEMWMTYVYIMLCMSIFCILVFYTYVHTSITVGWGRWPAPFALNAVGLRSSGPSLQEEAAWTWGGQSELNMKQSLNI